MLKFRYWLDIYELKSDEEQAAARQAFHVEEILKFHFHQLVP